MKETKTRWLHIMIGLAGSGAVFFFLQKSGMTAPAAMALALLFLMVYWWITRPVQLAVTALLPILAASVYPIAPIGDVLSFYFSPIAVLLVGTGILIAGMKKTGISRRMAVKALSLIGTNVRKQLTVWFLLSLVLSMFLPNAVVAAMLLPIAAAMIEYTAKSGDVETDEARNLIFIAIAWGAGLGGFGTPLGGAMNLVAITHIEALTGKEFLYITWTIKMLPYLALLAAGTLAVLVMIRIKNKQLPGSHEYFLEAGKKLGRITRQELTALGLFLAAVVLAFTRSLYAKILPEFKPYYAFLLMGMLAFFIQSKKQRLITFDVAVKEINWGMILLFSGGLAIGNILLSSGAADSVAAWMAGAQIGSALLLGAIFIFFAMFLSNASSNTAAVSVLIPIVIAVYGVEAFSGIQLPMVMLIAAACNAAYILPTSIRAIPAGYGLDIGVMAKYGLYAALVSGVLLTGALMLRLLAV